MRLAILVLAALPAAFASDISGKWVIDGDIQGNPVKLNCTVKQAGDGKVTGACKVNDADTVEISGEVKAEQIKFTFTAGGYTLDYAGTIDADTMKGGIEVSGTTGTFSGKRSPAEPAK